MKILWMTWKDGSHPLAGGAEVVNEELAQRLASDGHTVRFIVGGFAGGQSEERRDGYRITRVGGRWSVYWQAYQYYRTYLRGWADLIIDEINTIPFFVRWYAKEKNVLFVHMLCKEIWFYQLPAWIGWIGYLLEPIYLRLLADRRVITVSQSTKQDLLRHGFSVSRIHIISEGIQFHPLSHLRKAKKYVTFTLLSLGSIRPMKRTLEQIQAFEQLCSMGITVRLKIAGDASSAYGKTVLQYIRSSPYAQSIEYVGKVSSKQKQVLLQKCHILLMTSIKEGWGLTVTEAASQGTPSVVYDVDGLRDSVIDGVTGLVTMMNTPEGLSSAIQSLCRDSLIYEKFRVNAWQNSKRITFEHSYEDFKRALFR